MVLMEKINSDKYLSPKNSAKLIGCAPNTIILWCKKGLISHKKERRGLKNHYSINKASLVEYFERRKKN